MKHFLGWLFAPAAAALLGLPSANGGAQAPVAMSVPLKVVDASPGGRFDLQWLSRDGWVIAIGRGRARENPECVFLDLATGKMTLRVPGADRLAVSPDGRTIAVPRADKGTDLWDRANGKKTPLLPDRAGEVAAGGVFSPDSQYFFGYTYDPKADEVAPGHPASTPGRVVWARGGGKPIRRFAEQISASESWEFPCDDGRHLLMLTQKVLVEDEKIGWATVEWTVSVWDYLAGERRAVLMPPTRERRIIGPVDIVIPDEKLDEHGIPSEAFGLQVRSLRFGYALGIRFSPTGEVLLFPRLPAAALEVRKVGGIASDQGTGHFSLRDWLTGAEIHRIDLTRYVSEGNYPFGSSSDLYSKG
jgi:hypothetical protein